MTDGERRIAAAMAAIAVVGFMILWRPWAGGARLAFFAFGAGFAAALAGAAWWANRLACAFAGFLLAVFAPWGFAYVFGAPYLVLATGLAVRANRDARALVAGETPTDPARPGRPERRGASRSAPAGARSSGRVTPKRRGRT